MLQMSLQSMTGGMAPGRIERQHALLLHVWRDFGRVLGPADAPVSVGKATAFKGALAYRLGKHGIL
jgi:hypothetical protein